MFAKVFAVLCLLGLAHAGHLYGGYGGHGSYGGYGDLGGYGGYGQGYEVAPVHSYIAPVVAKTYVAPVVAKYVAAPVVAKYVAPAHAVSSVSQYSVHSNPIVKSYAPVSYAYSAPYVGHSYSPVAHGNYGYGAGYGYGSYGQHGW